MPPVLRRMRQQMPWLTPPWAGEDDRSIPLIMPKRTARGYEERLIGPTGEIIGPRDDAPPPLNTTVPPLSQLPAPPAMVLSRGGRPVDVVADDDLTRLQVKRRALEDYQPQKESVKKLLLRAGLNTILGGLPAAAQTLLGQGGVLDRRGGDEQWKQQQLGQTDATLGRMRTDRRQTMQDDYLQSQIDENRAQAARALREPAVPPVKPPAPARRIPPVKQVDEAGNEYLADAETGEPLLDAKGNMRYTGRAKVPPVKPDTTLGQRQALETNIQNAAGEKAKIAAALASTAEFLPDNDAYGVKVGERPNPIHQQLKARERKLDDDIRKWTADLGKVPTAVNDNAIEQRLRAEAKRKNLDPDEAVRRYREGKRAGKF